MKKLFSEFYDLKLFLYNNELVVVENYKTIYEIDKNFIKIDSIKIIGEGLVVTKLNNIEIEISGVIHEISLI